jgi:outer membrane protein assembly factor BamE
MPFRKYFLLGRFASLVFLVFVSGACSWVPRPISEYKIDIQQGNVLMQDMMAQIKPGSSRDQVRFILGTPVLMDMFHARRWDYVYRLQKGSTGEVEMRQFSTFFDGNDKLVRVDGDVSALQAADLSAKPTNRMREIDPGLIPERAEASPGEPGFFWKTDGKNRILT